MVASAAPPSGGEASPGLIYATRRVTLSVRTAAGKAKPNAVGTSEAVNEDDACEEGGSVHFSGDVNPNGTGTVNAAFNNCGQDGVIINGPATLRIDSVAPPAFDTDLTLSFDRLSLRGSVNIDIGGSIRLLSNLSTGRDTTTENVVALNNGTGRMTRFENVVIVDTPNLPFNNATSFSESVTGRVFDGVHGFVDITTPVPLAFPTLTQSFPSGGELLLAGTAGRHIRVMPSSGTRLALGLDVDGNGMERTVLLGWGDLSGPIGSDLGDTDGDGMHNSWETAFGLQPGVDDAATDSDGDGFSNLAEYQGGGNPKVDTSKPALIVGANFPAATDIAVPAFDRSVPGRSGLASDGTNFLLVSCRQLPSPGVFGVFISESGGVLGNLLISNDPCPQRTAVAFDGTNYLVVVARNTLSGASQLFGFRVSPTTRAVVNPQGDLIASTADGSTANLFPSIAFDGTKYLVVWGKTDAVGLRTIHAATVSTGGVVLSEFPITTAPLGVPGFPGNDSNPIVALGAGGRSLVVWTRGLTLQEDVFGSVVLPDGTVSPAFPIATLVNSQLASGVAFDGTNYLVVWNHVVDTLRIPLADGQIFGRRVTRDGTLLDGTASSPGIAISTGSFASQSASVAFSGSTYLVTWGVNSFTSLQPNGIFAARVSKDGVRLDGAPENLDVRVGGSPVLQLLYTDPVVASVGARGLIAWINSSQSFDPKDILAAPVISP